MGYLDEQRLRSKLGLVLRLLLDGDFAALEGLGWTSSPALQEIASHRDRVILALQHHSSLDIAVKQIEAFDISLALPTTDDDRNELTLKVCVVASPLGTYDVAGVGPGDPGESDYRGWYIPFDDSNVFANLPVPDTSPIPERFRPVVADVVRRLVERDFGGLIADGYYEIQGYREPGDLEAAIDGYNRRLIPDLPAEAWDESDHWEVDPGRWYVRLVFWTEAGPSELQLEGVISESESTIKFKIDLIHVA
jgi:hypothetical protein